MQKPEWKELYSVAAATYNHYVWVDLSLLFDCPEGVDKVATYLKPDRIQCMFHWLENGRDFDKYGHEISLTDEMRATWLNWQLKATNHCHEYNKWQKKYGKQNQ